MQRVSQDGLYDMHFHYYEKPGDTRLNLSWEVVPFNGYLVSTSGTNVRPGPGTNYSIVDFIPWNGTPVTLTFDKKTKGNDVNYNPQLGPGHHTDDWYRIAGTNQWISGAIVDGEQYLNV